MLFNDDVKEPKKISPNELTFGTQDPKLRKLLYPVEGETQLTEHEYLDVLKTDLQQIRSLYEAAKFEEQSKRLEQNDNFIPNKLQKGDFVLYDRAKGPKSNTFQPPLPGPFVVKEQRGNTIVANRFDESDDVNIHVDKATVFVGTEAQARDLAMRDTNEFVVSDITGWRGNPDSAKTLLFYVTYADGSRLWQPVGGKAADISKTQVFANYCAARPMLSPLLHTKDDGNTPRAIASAGPMTLQPGQEVFINIRYLSHTLYQFIDYDLPSKYETDYLIPASVQLVTRTKARITIPLTDHELILNKYDIQRYVSTVVIPPAITVDAALLRRHQCIVQLQLPDDWDALNTEDTMSLMDAHESAILNNINTTFVPPSEAFAFSIQAPNEDAMSPIVSQANEDEDEYQEMDLSRNGDTPTDASSVASTTSSSSNNPLPQDFEDYYDYPSINVETFDEAGMQALLEEEYLQSLIEEMQAHSPERRFHLIPEPCNCKVAYDSN